MKIGRTCVLISKYISKSKSRFSGKFNIDIKSNGITPDFSIDLTSNYIADSEIILMFSFILCNKIGVAKI